MAAKPAKVQGRPQDERVKRAHGVMTDIRSRLYRRLAEFVLAHEARIRSETLGEETYSFCLQQMEDLFLNKLNVVERAVAELGRSDSREGQTTTTTYQTVEVSARREDLPQKVADALAEHGDSDLLEVCVLRTDERHAEVLLIMAREDVAAPQDHTPSDHPKQPGGGGASGDSGT